MVHQPSQRFQVEPLRKFLERHAMALPAPYASQHNSRLSCIQFILSSFDLLGVLDEEVDATERSRLVEFVYSLQHPHGGFLPEADLASTYSALICLLVLGDDLSRVDRDAMVHFLAALHTPAGGFRQMLSHPPDASDLRFVYCAVVVSRLLHLAAAPEMQKKTVEFILSTQSYDGAFALHATAEGHGGYTYCAVASLACLGALDTLTPARRDRLVQWAVFQQELGFAGRIGKVSDSCYSFWIGAALKILGALHLIDVEKSELFLCTMQSKMGGFTKSGDGFPDLLHTYMALAALALHPMQDVDAPEVAFDDSVSATAAANGPAPVQQQAAATTTDSSATTASPSPDATPAAADEDPIQRLGEIDPVFNISVRALHHWKARSEVKSN
ncbi:geranylgeranyl transferase type-1 subunit beta [Blastocladiella emersonii ATCC 22665]|nr:geranylgeranyl transferase type-1 subunit beta [Blastocladiella emersonii ATCC 22665]